MLPQPRTGPAMPMLAVVRMRFGNAEPEVVKPIDILVGRKVRSSFQLYRKRSLQLAKAQHLRNFMQLPTSLAQAPGTCVDQRADTSLTAWMRSCHVPQTK